MEYEEKFNDLSRYAPPVSQGEEALARKFLEGLRPTIGKIVATRDLYTLSLTISHLALVPFRHRSETKGSNMTFMQTLTQLLGEQICYIVYTWNLADLDVTTLHDLSDQVVPLEYVFRFLM